MSALPLGPREQFIQTHRNLMSESRNHLTQDSEMIDPNIALENKVTLLGKLLHLKEDYLTYQEILLNDYDHNKTELDNATKFYDKCCKRFTLLTELSREDYYSGEKLEKVVQDHLQLLNLKNTSYPSLHPVTELAEPKKVITEQYSPESDGFDIITWGSESSVVKSDAHVLPFSMAERIFSIEIERYTQLYVNPETDEVILLKNLSFLVESFKTLFESGNHYKQDITLYQTQYESFLEQFKLNSPLNDLGVNWNNPDSILECIERYLADPSNPKQPAAPTFTAAGLSQIDDGVEIARRLAPYSSSSSAASSSSSPLSAMRLNVGLQEQLRGMTQSARQVDENSDDRLIPFHEICRFPNGAKIFLGDPQLVNELREKQEGIELDAEKFLERGIGFDYFNDPVAAKQKCGKMDSIPGMVISTNGRSDGSPGTLDIGKAEINHRQFPIVEDDNLYHTYLEGEKIQQLLSIFLEIDDAINNGKGVYIHCNGGEHRSPTTLILYFATRSGCRFDQAWNLVQQTRTHVKPFVDDHTQFTTFAYAYHKREFPHLYN